MSKRLAPIAIVVATAVAAAGVLTSTSSGASQAQRTIGLVGGDSFFVNGGKSAAAALGDQLAISYPNDQASEISTIESLVAEHAAAIAVPQRFRVPASAVASALAQARTAGIPTLSFDGRFPGSLWVNQPNSAQFMHALADALATQMRQRGQFVIVSCRPLKRAALYTAVGTWLKETESYVERRYPRMHRVGVVYGSASGTLDIGPVLRKHPRLRGLDFLCPDEAASGPPQLIGAFKLGKVFSAGNGGPCPPLEILPDANSVRAGATEIVCARNDTKLGYLTIWAADRLASGHKFTPGTYDVGRPVGSVHYYRHHEELRLGQPLTITQANVDKYAPYG